MVAMYGGCVSDVSASNDVPLVTYGVTLLSDVVVTCDMSEVSAARFPCSVCVVTLVSEVLDCVCAATAILLCMCSFWCDGVALDVVCVVVNVSAKLSRSDPVLCGTLANVTVFNPSESEMHHLCVCPADDLVGCERTWDIALAGWSG